MAEKNVSANSIESSRGRNENWWFNSVGGGDFFDPDYLLVVRATPINWESFLCRREVTYAIYNLL